MSFSDSELSKILPTNGPDINEAKKYLNKYKNESICIKIGGSVLNDESLFNILIEDISLLSKINFNPIIIHGGGKYIHFNSGIVTSFKELRVNKILKKLEEQFKNIVVIVFLLNLRLVFTIWLIYIKLHQFLNIWG